MWHTHAANELRCGAKVICMMMNIVNYVPVLVYLVAGLEGISLAHLFALYKLVMKVLSEVCDTCARRLN